MSGSALLLSIFVICCTTCQPYPQSVGWLRSFYVSTAQKFAHATQECMSYAVFNASAYGISCLIPTLVHWKEESMDMWREGEQTTDLCKSFDLYKRATRLFDEILDFKDAIEEERDRFINLDKIKAAWLAKCPVYVSAPTEQRVSLYYTPDDKFLQHPESHWWKCCAWVDQVKDTWERDFYLKQLQDQEVVKYGDTVAVGFKDGFYLSDDAPLLKWNKREIGSWEWWRIESFCSNDLYKYGIVHLGDLIMFRSMDGEGYYVSVQSIFSHRTTTNGPYHFIMLDTNGTFPYIN